MNKVQKIVEEIVNLSEPERKLLLDTLKEMYPENSVPKNAFVVGSNYDFWNNKEDDEYDKL